MGQNLDISFLGRTSEQVDMVVVTAAVLEWYLERLEHDTVPVVILPKQKKVKQDRGMHFHAIPELFLQVSGESLMSNRSGTVTFTEGTVGIIPRGVPHYEECGPGTRPFGNLVFYLDRGMMGAHVSVGGAGGEPRIVKHEQYRTAYDSRINAYLDDLVHYADWHDRPGLMLKRGLLTALLSHMLGILQNPTVAWKKEHFKIARCRQLVAAHLFDQKLNVRMLAGMINCSSDYLSHLFRTETGIRLIQYINEERVKHACHLLGNTPLNIGEIAWASGFYDMAYFSRVFRGMHGTSPGRYRERLKQVGI